MNVPSAFACSLLGVLSVAPRLPASSLDDLEWVNPRPHGHTLLGIARGNGIYVAAGTGGTLQTSSDHGATWTQQNAVVDPDRRYESVEFLNGKFYAVGAQRFEGLISCSPDGVDWDHQVLPGSGAITAIAYGNNTFVTTGETYTSSDGQTWAPGESFADNGSDITFGDGLFVAVDRGFSFRSSIRTSPDGVEWTPVRNNDVLTQLSAVTHGNGRFVAVGFQQSMESADGEEWSTNPQGFSFTPNDVDFRDGVFYATGQNVQSSSDGIAWNFEVGFQYFDPVTFEPVSSNFGYGIAHSDTSLVSVGTSGDIWNKVGDGDWTRRSEGFTLDPLSDVTHGTVMVNGEPVGKYVATHSTLNAGSPGGLMVSDDGSRWTSAQRTGPDLRAVVIGNHRIVAVGKFSDSNAAPTRVYTSDDGVAFEEHALPVSGPLLDVAFAGDTFVAVGQTGFIFTSTDTGGGWSEWTQQESGVDFTLNAVAHGIAASTGEIIVTTDADCRYPDGWLEGMVSHFGPGVTMVVGYVETTRRGAVRRFLHAFETIDWLSLMIVSRSLTRFGWKFASSANNQAYRRDAFEAAGGFGASGRAPSGDEDLLTQRLGRLPNSRIVFASRPETRVLTHAVDSWLQLFRQRRRWVSRYHHPMHYHPAFLTSIVLLGFQSIALSAAILAAPFVPALQPWVIALWGAEIAIMTLGVGIGAHQLGRDDLVGPELIGWTLLHPFFIATIVIGSFVRDGAWTAGRTGYRRRWLARRTREWRRRLRDLAGRSS